MSVNSQLTNKKIREYKTEVTATVFECDSTTVIRGAHRWQSRAVYSVNSEKYIYIIERVVPIGTTFQLYYLPSDPTKAILVNQNQFNDYPRKKP